MKKAIVIGATSGIGRHLAEILLENGYKIGITGRRKELLESFYQQYPESICYSQMDLQDISSIEAKCYELIDQLGGLDLFVNSAGIGEENKQLNFSVEQNVLSTNVIGFTCITDWAMNFFKKQGRGHLVNISSLAGIRGNGIAPSYNATKAYQINYLEGLRLNAHYTNNPITITDVRPGFVKTRMAKGNGLFWVAPVEKAAQQIYCAISSKKKVVYITKRWKLIGWLLYVLPFKILKKL